MAQFGLIVLILLLGATQSILTGIFGAPSIIAGMVASRAITFRKAVILSTVAQFLGPFLLGAAAATVIGSEVVSTEGVPPAALACGLAATILWMVISFYLRIPSSSTHAILGGLIGAVITASGLSAIHSPGLFKVLLSLFVSAPVGFLGGFLMTRFLYWLARGATPRINQRFNQGQWVTAFGLGIALGSINAQNAMGIVALGLVLSGLFQHFQIPLGLVALCASGLAIGNLVGGLRLVKSVGSRFFQIRPIHAFSAELAGGLIITISSLLGGNVSATHVSNFAIVGAGSAERLSLVRWHFAKNVFTTWILTIPMTALLACLLYSILEVLGLK